MIHRHCVVHPKQWVGGSESSKVPGGKSRYQPPAPWEEFGHAEQSMATTIRGQGLVTAFFLKVPVQSF